MANGGKSFNGTSDRIQKTLGSAFAISGGITFGGWMIDGNQGAAISAAGCYDHSSVGESGIEFQKTSGNKLQAGTRNSGGPDGSVQSSGTFTDGTSWFPLLATSNGSSMTVYLNSTTGQNVTGLVIGGVSLQFLEFGCLQRSGSGSFLGAHSWAQIFVDSRIWTATEIGHWMNDNWTAAKVENVAGTNSLLWWPLAFTLSGTAGMANAACATDGTVTGTTDLNVDPAAMVYPSGVSVPSSDYRGLFVLP